jgi:hypothetical protein
VAAIHQSRAAQPAALVRAAATRADARARVRTAAAAPDEFALEGAWHVLVHYRDAAGPNPDEWRWEDRVWDFRREGERLVWTEYLLVQFSDNQGRFTDLGTNMAARVPGAWEPNFRQQEEIRNGLRVLGRSSRRQRLERAASGGWQSPAGAEALARLAETPVFLSQWSIGGSPDHPVFSQLDELRSAGESEPIGFVRYTTERRESRGDARLLGSYQRDGRRHGRFRMVPTRLAGREARPEPSGGHVRLAPGEDIKPQARLLWSWLRPFRSFGARRLRIETTPPGALLDLAYLRRGTQLDYARVQAPVTVEPPSRVSALPQDVLAVRAQADGYERNTHAVPVQSGQDELAIELEPLPNTLDLVGWTTLAGRSSLALHTDVEPVLRTRRRVAGVGRERVGRCALVFDAELRDRLDPAELRRTFDSAPPFVVPVLRASLRRLGELAPDGRLHLRDGTRLEPGRPLEIELGLQRGEQVEGALAFLRALVEALEPAAWRDVALRGLVAPESDPVAFGHALADARAAEAACRAGAAAGDPHPQRSMRNIRNETTASPLG